MENQENKVEEDIQKINKKNEKKNLKNIQKNEDDKSKCKKIDITIPIQQLFEFIVSIKVVILIHLVFMIKILLKNNVGNNIWDVVIVTIILVILKFIDVKSKEFEFKSKQDQFLYEQIELMNDQDKKEIIKELIEK